MALQELISKKLQLESQWAQQALAQGRVTPDMKWLDIKIYVATTRLEELRDVRIKAKLSNFAYEAEQQIVATALPRVKQFSHQVFKL